MSFDFKAYPSNAELLDDGNLDEEKILLAETLLRQSFIEIFSIENL